MRAYLATTGTLFGLLALLHIWRTIEEWPGAGQEQWHIYTIAVIGVLAAALSVWAWRLRRTVR